MSVDILHAVTSSLSLVVLRGQLRYLKASGFHPAVLSAPGAFVDETRQQESVPVFEIPMERDLSALKDLRSLGRIWQLLRRIRPALCNAGTPKAGFVVTVAAWLARVPCRVYTLRGLRLETARGPKRYLLYAAERITCTCAHRVICVSPSLRDRAVAMKLVSPSRALVLAFGSSNGIEARRFVPTPARVQRAAEIRRELEQHEPTPSDLTRLPFYRRDMSQQIVGGSATVAGVNAALAELARRKLSLTKYPELLSNASTLDAVSLQEALRLIDPKAVVFVLVGDSVRVRSQLDAAGVTIIPIHQ